MITYEEALEIARVVKDSCNKNRTMSIRKKSQRIEIANRIEQLKNLLGTTSEDLMRAAGISGPAIRMDGTGSAAGTIPDRDIRKDMQLVQGFLRMGARR